MWTVHRSRCSDRHSLRNELHSRMFVKERRGACQERCLPRQMHILLYPKLHLEHLLGSELSFWSHQWLIQCSALHNFQSSLKLIECTADREQYGVRFRWLTPSSRQRVAVTESKQRVITYYSLVRAMNFLKFIGHSVHANFYHHITIITTYITPMKFIDNTHKHYSNFPWIPLEIAVK